MEKFLSLSADTINQQEPGTMVSRFVGDVDTVENLFTSGIISMFADTCKILSILAVIWFRNKGLTLVLLFYCHFVLVYQTCTEKYVNRADREPKSSRPCLRSCAGDDSQYSDDPLLWKRKIYGRAV